MHLAQPALSQLVRELERELGLRLFDRTTRRVELTEGGREFRAASGKIIQDLDVAIRNASDIAELRRGRVIIAAPPLLAAVLLPQAIAQSNSSGTSGDIARRADRNDREGCAGRASTLWMWHFLHRRRWYRALATRARQPAVVLFAQTPARAAQGHEVERTQGTAAYCPDPQQRNSIARRSRLRGGQDAAQSSFRGVANHDSTCTRRSWPRRCSSALICEGRGAASHFGCDRPHRTNDHARYRDDPCKWTIT